MIVETFNFSLSELTDLVNTVKDATCKALVEDGVMSTDPASDYCVILVQKGWWGSVLDKLFGVAEGKTQVHILHIRKRLGEK